MQKIKSSAEKGAKNRGSNYSRNKKPRPWGDQRKKSSTILVSKTSKNRKWPIFTRRKKNKEQVEGADKFSRHLGREAKIYGGMT